MSDRAIVRNVVRACAGVAALGASAVALDALLHGPERLRNWESLELEDAPEGDFCCVGDGVRMHFCMRGPSGVAGAAVREPIILVHGLMSSTGEWSRNIDVLAKGRQVWAIDLIGFGFSERVKEPHYSVKYYARSLAEFMDAHDIQRASLVGHSLGGGVALQFAHDYSERVGRLVLIAPAAYIFGYFRAVQFAARLPYIPRALAGAMLSNPGLHRVAFRNALGDPARLSEDALAERLRASQVKGTLDALLAMSASPHATDLPEGLDSIRTPTLIVWGDKDMVLPLRHGRRLARELPNAELVVLEGAGHVPNEEYPDIVNGLILNFIDKEN